jgi:hypothetical protein
MRATKIQLEAQKVTLLAENTSKHDEVVRLRPAHGVMVGGPEVNDMDGWAINAREVETVTLAPSESIYGFSGSGSICHVLVGKRA